jgi:hypothetical protein
MYSSAQSAPTFTYTVNLIGTARVRITSTPAGIDCPGVCSYTWPADASQIFTITVTPGPGVLTSLNCTPTDPRIAGKQIICPQGSFKPNTIYAWPQSCELPGGKIANCGPFVTFNEAEGLYAMGTGKYADAMAAFSKTAALGSAVSQNAIGLLYLQGEGVPANYAKALSWFQKAAAQGNSAGALNIALMYLAGWGVPQDQTQALAWLRRAGYSTFPDTSLTRAAQAQAALANTPQPAPAPQQTASSGSSQPAAGTIVPSVGSCVTTYNRGGGVAVHNSCSQLIQLTVWANDGGYFSAGVGPNEDIPTLFLPTENLKFFACPANSWIQESSTNPTVTYNTQNYECKSLN